MRRLSHMGYDAFAPTGYDKSFLVRIARFFSTQRPERKRRSLPGPPFLLFFSKSWGVGPATPQTLLISKESPAPKGEGFSLETAKTWPHAPNLILG